MLSKHQKTLFFVRSLCFTDNSFHVEHFENISLFRTSRSLARGHPQTLVSILSKYAILEVPRGTSQYQPRHSRKHPVPPPLKSQRSVGNAPSPSLTDCSAILEKRRGNISSFDNKKTKKTLLLMRTKKNATVSPLMFHVEQSSSRCALLRKLLCSTNTRKENRGRMCG